MKKTLFLATILSAVLSSAAFATTTNWSVTDTSHASDAITLNSGDRLNLANGSGESSGSGNANTTFTSGLITVNSGATLYVHGWTKGVKTVSSSDKLKIASPIALNGGTIHQEDGSYAYTGAISVSGNSVYESRWAKGVAFSAINKAEDTTANSTLTLQQNNSSDAGYSLFSLNGEGNYNGTLTLRNADGDVRMHVVLNHADAIKGAKLETHAANTLGDVLLNVGTVNVRALSGAGTVALAKDCTDSISADANVTAATLNVTGTDNAAFSGTLAAGVTLAIAAGASQTLDSATLNSAIENHGTLTFSGTTNLSGMTAISSTELTYGDTAAGATASGNGYCFGSATYQVVNGEVGSVNIASGADFKDANLTGGTYNADNGTVLISQTEAAGSYYVNSGTATYANGSAMASDATTHIYSAAGTAISIAEGASLSASKLTANGATALTGSGTYVLAPATASLGSNVSLGTGWTGAVELSGTMTGNQKFENLSNADSRVRLHGFAGWFSPSTLSANFELVNEGDTPAYTITGTNNGGAYGFSGKLSGSGDIAYTQTNESRWGSYTFSGDLSEWGGNFINRTNGSRTINLTPKGTVIGSGVKNESGSAMTVNITGSGLTMNGNLLNSGSGTMAVNVTAGSSVEFAGAIHANTLTLADTASATLSGSIDLSSTLNKGNGALTLSGATLNVDATNLDAYTMKTAGQETWSDAEHQQGFLTSNGAVYYLMSGTVTAGSSASFVADSALGTGSINADNEVIFTATSYTSTTWVQKEQDMTMDADFLAAAHAISIQTTDAALSVTSGTLDFTHVTIAEGANVASLTVAGTDAAMTVNNDAAAGVASLIIGDGGTVTVVGNNNETGFVRGTVDINAGGKLVLNGHDALGYDGTATGTVTLTGSADKLAILELAETTDNRNLTKSQDIKLNGNALVTGTTFNTYKGKILVSGTNNTIAAEMNLRNAIEVNIADADDTLVMTGGISTQGSAALTQTGAGALTIQGGTIGAGVKISSNGTGNAVTLDGVTLDGRLDVYGSNSNGFVFTNGASSAAGYTGHALVVGDGNATTVKMQSGDYNFSESNLAVGANATLVIAKDAELIVNGIQNSSQYPENNGDVRVDGDTEAKGSLTVTGATSLTNFVNYGEATFSAAFTAKNVTVGGTATFSGSTSITNLTTDGEAAQVTLSNGDITLSSLTLGGGTVSVMNGSNEASLTVTALNVNTNSVMNANLVTAEGSQLYFGGVLTMGSTVEFGADTIIIVSDAIAAQIANGDIVTLIDSIDADADITSLAGVGIYTGSQETGLVYLTDTHVLAHEDGTFYVTTPEPATATLSLLALAALAARRKRH